MTPPPDINNRLTDEIRCWREGSQRRDRYRLHSEAPYLEPTAPRYDASPKQTLTTRTWSVTQEVQGYVSNQNNRMAATSIHLPRSANSVTRTATGGTSRSDETTASHYMKTMISSACSHWRSTLMSNLDERFSRLAASSRRCWDWSRLQVRCIPTSRVHQGNFLMVWRRSWEGRMHYG